MAGKNDPSIYDDRTTIGSSDELDEYGVWVKSEPQDLSSSLPDIEELPDIDTGFADDLELPDFSNDPSAEAAFSAPGSDSTADLEFEEIPETSELPTGLDPISVDKDGFTEVSMNDFLDSETTLAPPKSIDFGNLDSNVAEMEPENLEPVPQTAGASPGAADLSTQLLMKIADELSSIKKELASLKHELGVVRKEVKSEAAEPKGGGFFDEEDDEKIALTGDELDNILNTADFTEEAGSGEALGDQGVENGGLLDLEADSELNAEENLSDKDDLLSESGEEENSGFTDPVDMSFDEVDLSELDGAIEVEDKVKNLNDELDISLDLSTEDLPDFSAEPPELNDLRQEGAMPVTPAPEDASYLEEDPLAADFSAGDQIDLSGAVIEEPDLSAHITENPVSEPAIDNISIDLEMEEPNSLGISAADASADALANAAGDDFVFEPEETMEIPVTEEPVIDDAGPLAADSPFSSEDLDLGPPAADSPFSSEDLDIGSMPAFSEEPVIDDAGPLAADSPFSSEEPDLGSPAALSGGADPFAGPLEAPAEESPALPPAAEELGGPSGAIPSNLKQELKTVLSYMDQLLESLPEDKIEEFAKSEYFDTYKKLFEELGLV
ncbi:MAG: hypothetical protein LBE02_07140 [Spirochaetaceae bacterium]|jgi:hypothetical protein|nr:hypothetical protein [Spirochaetaceae bacterium]